MIFSSDRRKNSDRERHPARVRRIVFLFAVALSGCAHVRDLPRPEPRPLGRDIPTFHPPALSSTAPSETKFEQPTGTITLSQALSLALARGPELEAFAWSRRAADARALQAGLHPNPTVSLQAAQFGGSSTTLSDFNGAETTLQLSQLVELGGKRSARLKLAHREESLADWDYEAKRLDVLTSCTRLFVGVIAAQRRLALAEESVTLAQNVKDTVAIRVGAGTAAPSEETRASVTLSLQRLTRDDAERMLVAARARLAATWGGTSSEFQAAEGDFETIRRVPNEFSLEQRLLQNPDVERWAVELDRRQAAVDLEEAKRWPDLSISAGATRFEAEDDVAFLAGISIPLPLFNRNQGGVREATALLARTRAERQTALVHVRIQLATAHAKLSSAYSAASALSEEILPGASSVFAAVTAGYERGKFSHLEVLDAQRTMLQARGQYIDALEAYHQARADIERLVGEALEPGH